MAVEAALIFPLLVLLVFGMIEFALLMRDHVATTSAVRAGARTASASGSSPDFVNLTVAAMEKAGTALPKDSYEALWIYKADDRGLPIGSSSDNPFDPAGCISQCIRYEWSEARDEFRPVDVNAWPQSSIRACPGAPFDAVGIYLSANHDWITGLFGTSTLVSDRAVLNFEPFAIEDCE